MESYHYDWFGGPFMDVLGFLSVCVPKSAVVIPDSRRIDDELVSEGTDGKTKYRVVTNGAGTHVLIRACHSKYADQPPTTTRWMVPLWGGNEEDSHAKMVQQAMGALAFGRVSGLFGHALPPCAEVITPPDADYIEFIWRKAELPGE